MLVFVRLGDDAHIPDRTAYVGDDERACWRAIVADWTYPADGLVCDPCTDDGLILGAADATKLRAVGLCPDEEQVDSVRAEVARARGAPQDVLPQEIRRGNIGILAGEPLYRGGRRHTVAQELWPDRRIAQQSCPGSHACGETGKRTE